MPSSTAPGRKKVVLDTNIVVSSLLSNHGFSSKVVEKLILDEIENYTSKEIIEEIKNVFLRPEITLRAEKSAIIFTLQQYELKSKIVIPRQAVKIVKDDPDDDKFIECAVESKAECIISGDKHLLAIQNYSNIKILTPREFIESFNK